MGIFDRFKKPKRKPRITGRRGFAGAKTDQFLQGWTTTNRSADAELFVALRTLRARSRDLAINDDYVGRFLRLVKSNVVGARGIGLQNRAREDNGVLDTRANELIESAWREWGQVGICTLDGRLSWIDACSLFMETTARDGEVLVRLVRDPDINRFGFALQFIDVDHLDETYNQTARDPGGRRIRLSVEYDANGKALAYYLLKNHPNATALDYQAQKRIRYPADEIIHGFLTNRAEQGRGYPWTAQSLRRLKMLSGYEYSELIASRVSSSKMGFYIEPDGDAYMGDYEEDFSPVTEAEPGTFERLPYGTEFKSWDPEHPVAAYEAFVLAILRGIASGLGVSYVSLTNDLRSVSYSSIRQGALDERDFWRSLQTWLIEHFVGPVFKAWLQMTLTTGAVNLPMGKFRKFHNPVWRPRGWQWVDPLKEVRANIEAVKNNLRSLQGVVGEAGVDVEDILEDNKIAQELAAKYGTTLDILGGDNVKA